MITVACVLRSGGIYDSEWVRKLRDGVARNLSLPHRFVALSDVDVPCERIPLAENWNGWWAKIELFRPELFDGLVLYLDLDSVVVGPLDKLVEYDHCFTGSHDFYHNNFCSTAMAWRGEYSFIYDAFKANPNALSRRYDRLLPIEKRIGDQAFIEDMLKSRRVPIDQFRHIGDPRFIASYKVDKCQTAPPADAAVVAFHGRPKPSELKTGWVPKAWR